MGSKYKHLFSPIRIRGIDFKNRITLAPPSPNHASPDGLVTHEFVDWFRMFARGGTSVLYVGNSSIDIRECKDEECQLDLSSDRAVLPLSWYAEMAAAYDCHASLEINHNGKDTAFETVGHAPYSASSIITSSERTRAARLGRDPIPSIEMSLEKIAETVEKYAMAALRMKRAGMDICLVHGGHGNLISQFTSPLYNFRQDEYGGSTERRARFAVEVVEAIRKKCGEDFVIEYRISADEIAEEGMHFDETLRLIALLADKIDILHVSAGIHSDFNMKYYRNWCQNYMMPHGFNVHYARDIKARFPNLLVNTVGSITDLDLAEEILANGHADFVAMCRPLMADPDMPRKYAANKPEDRRPCLRCDACAKRLGGGGMSDPRVINCAVNPISGLTSKLKDGTVPKAGVRKKVAVVGGGPGGVYAMMALCDRGHDVTLYEKSGELGGNLIGAAAPPFKSDCRDYLAWFRREAAKYKARLLLNTEATKELLDRENYDALILAVGADPIRPKLPGADKPHVCWAPEAETGGLSVGERIAIIGAGSVGVEAALDFAERGKTVALVELADEDAALVNLFKGAGTSAPELKTLLDENANIRQYYGARLKEIRDDTILCRNAAGEEIEIEADSVLLAMGMRPRYELVEELRHCAPETEVFVVGDAKVAGNISGATNAGFQAALHI
ncbi:MAG: NAD(P)/FAD-dependent oxidoreductase [Clostridiales Family XIII bacterium]|jgi:2,4-dienoyl-CoA reductase-like NADH-dependent reductase (Old Yellow Enzyme family)/thioredoxin reductase|nr:NAD(P)/FAD-dependent oxidoreductase [Clostridiales Family XIII bacterium]